MRIRDVLKTTVAAVYFLVKDDLFISWWNIIWYGLCHKRILDIREYSNSLLPLDTCVFPLSLKVDMGRYITLVSEMICHFQWEVLKAYTLCIVFPFFPNWSSWNPGAIYASLIPRVTRRNKDPADPHWSCNMNGIGEKKISLLFFLSSSSWSNNQIDMRCINRGT